MKAYVGRIRHFNVDGALLMTFDPEDFLLLGMVNTVHVKKVQMNANESLDQLIYGRGVLIH